MTTVQGFVNIEFTDVEIFSTAANQWDIDFRLLESGDFKADLLHFISSDFHFASTSMTRKVDQQGASPYNVWTFAVLMTPFSSFNWHGSYVSMNEVMIYKPYSEINTISKNPFRVLIYSVNEEKFERVCHHLGYDDVLGIIKSTDKVQCNINDLNHLRQELIRIDAFLRTAYSKGGNITMGLSETEFSALEALIQCLANSDTTPKKRPKKLKDYALTQALACIEGQLNETLTVSRLCQIAGVSNRTLEHAFKERFGVPPKTYIKYLRLNRLHRDLIAMDPKPGMISQAAHNWGFWHMGQLAKDYKSLFGELPSATLQKRHEDEIIFIK